MNRTFTSILKIMILCLLLNAGSFSPVAAQAKTNQIALNEALKRIEQKFNAHFAYEHNLLDGKYTTAEALQGKSIEETLKNVLYPNNLIFLYVSENTYSVVARDASFFSFPGNPSLTNHTIDNGFSHSLRGRITNTDGEAIPFATVAIKGTNQGVLTNNTGDFFLPSVHISDIVIVSSLGYQKQEYAITEKLVLNVTLAQDSRNMLNEVTIVSNGYQQIAKERSTAAIATISAKELEKFPSPNVLQRLEGQLPGVQISVLSGDRSFTYLNTQLAPNSGTRTIGANDYNIGIRGISTLPGQLSEKFPLLVVDGAISNLDISNFNPSDIDNISFLKDAAAASIWGVRAANGVIVITTKKGKKNQAPAIAFSMNFMVADKPDLNYLKTMNSAQTLAYEKELVNRNFITPNAGTGYYAALNTVSEGTSLALKLKAGTITQAQYDSRIAQLSALDNRSQISEYLLQRASNQQYNFSVSNATDNNSYFYSTSYSKEIPNSQNVSGQRITSTLNNDWKIFKVTTLSTNLKGTFFTYANGGLPLSSVYSLGRTNLLPYNMLADANGNGIAYARYTPEFTNTLTGNGFKPWTYNYINERDNADNVQRDNNFIANINLRVPIVKGLAASALYSLERSYSTTRVNYNQNTYTFRNLVNYYTFPTAANNSLGITNGGILQQINTNQNNYSLRAQLEYNNIIKSDHEINAIGGSEIRETNVGQGSYSLFGYNPSTGSTNNNINFSSTPTYSWVGGNALTDLTSFNGGGYPTQLDQKRRFLSYYSNASYTYKRKYVLSGSVRYDDYNNFGLDRKYRATPLWSGGLKWNASNENFIKPISWIDNLALRATYGVNGNLGLNNYPFTNITQIPSDPVTGQPYAIINNLAIPELRWEKVYVTNAGIDFALFKNRLSGSLDIYQKRSRDLLYSFPISNVYIGNVGSGYLTRNAASLNGKGVDLGLNGSLLSSSVLGLNLGGTFSYNTNTITDSRFTPETYATLFSSALAGVGPIVNYPADKLLVYRNAGLDANGLTQIYDQNNNIIKATTSSITSFSTIKYAGRTTAPYFGSVNTTLRYKRFSLYALATYQYGGVFLKPTIQSYITSSSRVNYDISAAIADRWEQAGDENTTVVPGLNGTATAVSTSLFRYQNSDINVLKSDYVRLRQLSFNYQLPTQLLNKVKVKNAQVGLSVNNLGLLWRANKAGYDPDFANYSTSPRSLPAATSYNFSLNLNF